MAEPFPSIAGASLTELIEQLTHYALSNGLLIYPPGFEAYQPTVAPVTLYPTPLPRSEFNKGVAISTKFNELYSNVVVEKSWLIEVIDELSKFDRDFTGKLYETYLEAESSIVQPVSLGLFRSDYMLDTVSGNIKQVEFNTVSVSFGGLSPKVGNLHSFLNNQGLYGKPKYYKEEDLPVSYSTAGLANGLYEAAKYYDTTERASDTIVLFVVQPGERNVFDQRAVEYSLAEKGVKSKRVDFTKVVTSVKVDQSTNKVYYGNEEVSVVYYRCGYAPSEYTGPETWEARLLLEKTKAVKCPSLLVQLSGVKKVQQLLTNNSILSKYLENNDELSSTFVKIYPLDDTEEGLLGKKLAFEQPERFVLKPQREGGGNNIYKEDIPSFLESIEAKDWGAYILMELIIPPIHENKILRNGDVLSEGVVSELGIFGTILFNEKSGSIIHNEESGYLLRSKTSSSNEGGVAAGFGCVDSLYLYE
ncbi:hypothetical protein OGAPHI_000526 [Ogataea philodendri]|uniref:Glutathione synthetase n=1 Tax=Ogataea philodendri TaxID=1378263 RepID=A0A9P8PFH1_9ASCO|nr:uncharacterized protein OGAPHI_000526 [Ogataea philodendri]KAH3671303.1 hypothetical protein OGAPHI_000526 [Ogataea philodendri]